MGDDIRIDKWLWAVRLFKTRSLASEACKKGRVFINGQECKASRTVHIGDQVEVKEPPVTFRYKVLDLAEKRMGAKLVPGFLEDITPEDQKEILEMQNLDRKYNRRKGLGRPTKKERRDIDKFRDDV
ncbi:RNA-binding S4 domain-containing protein [Saccharicrinis sp. FJH54]|uniref:RNA-binding S4 domain-containing protein n=1 Tax=Saccharicrinis sp. FJH54 TaxID=3344665 RepID=UPI0035D47E4D